MGIHIAIGVDDGLGFVMGPKALVVAEAHRDRLVATVHGNQVDVDIDDEVTLRRTSIDSQQVAVFRLSERDQPQRTDVIGRVDETIVIGMLKFADNDGLSRIVGKQARAFQNSGIELVLALVISAPIAEM